MYAYTIVQLGTDGSRETLEEIAATPLLTEHEMEEFVGDRQVYWMRRIKQPDMNMVKIERNLIPLR